MSGHATRPGEGGQAVLERIQVSVLPIGKHATSPATSALPVEKQDVDITVRKYNSTCYSQYKVLIQMSMHKMRCITILSVSLSNANIYSYRRHFNVIFIMC